MCVLTWKNLCKEWAIIEYDHSFDISPLHCQMLFKEIPIGRCAIIFFSFPGLFLGFWAFSAFFDHFLATALLCLVKVDLPTFVVNVSCSKFKPTKVLPKTLKPLNYYSEFPV